MDVLEKLIRMLGEKGPSVRVGILENTARHARNAGDSGSVVEEGNADIGAKHEFGIGVPQRSFLRMPLETQMQQFLKAERIDESTIKDALKEGTLVPLAAQVAAAAENAVKGAFETGGYGQWAPHAPGYVNATGELLVDTTQLRDSISSEVEED